VLDATQIDVAHHRSGAGPCHVVLNEDVLLQDRDLVTLPVLGDRHQLVGDPWRDRHGLTAPTALAARPRPRRPDPAAGSTGRDLLLDRLRPGSGGAGRGRGLRGRRGGVVGARRPGPPTAPPPGLCPARPPPPPPPPPPPF